MSVAVPWTPQEDALLRQMRAAGVSFAAIASRLHRGVKSCEERAARIGLPRTVAKAVRHHGWPEKQDARLREMHAAGVAFSTIAERLGVSRCAVAGRVRRLKLPARRNEPPPKPEPTKAQVPPGRKFTTPKPVTPPSSERRDLPVETPAVGVTFWELRPQHCRWMVQGRGLAGIYCGAMRSAENCSYCAEHRLRSLDRRSVERLAA